MQISPFYFIKPEYGYVLLSIVALALQVLLIGFIAPGRMRSQVFSQRFMKQNFSEIHGQEIHEEISKGGYPDMGSGRYSQLLSYEEWFKFNNAQRAHQNFVENIASSLAFIAIGGLYYPIPQAAIALVMMLGRIAYTIGYMRGGPGGRVVGVLLWDLGLLASLVLACISSIMLVIGKSN